VGSSPEDIIHSRCQIRQRLYRNALTPLSSLNLPVALRGGLSVDLNSVLLQVDEPGFGDPGSGVEGKFDLPVILKGGLGHLDHEKDVLRPWVSGGVVVRAADEQSQIRLRFRMLSQMNRVLYTDHSAPSHPL
jgi:hypothetical protein